MNLWWILGMSCRGKALLPAICRGELEANFDCRTPELGNYELLTRKLIVAYRLYKIWESINLNKNIIKAMSKSFTKSLRRRKFIFIIFKAAFRLAGSKQNLSNNNDAKIVIYPQDIIFGALLVQFRRQLKPMFLEIIDLITLINNNSVPIPLPESTFFQSENGVSLGPVPEKTSVLPTQENRKQRRIKLQQSIQDITKANRWKYRRYRHFNSTNIDEELLRLIEELIEKDVGKRSHDKVILATFLYQVLKLEYERPSPDSNFTLINEIDMEKSIDNLDRIQADQSGQHNHSQIITDNPDIISGATLFIRQKEINQIIQILTRREKRSVALVGPPGIGKTSLVYGMAHLFADFNKNGQNLSKVTPLHRHLYLKKIVEVDQFDSASHHSFYLGSQKPSLISKLLKESEQADNLIVFTRDIHTLLDPAGGDAASAAAHHPSPERDKLRSALIKNQIQCIGTTDRVSFKKCVDSNPMWRRIFTSVPIDEPTEELSASIVEKKIEGYRKHYNLKYDDAVVKASLTLGDRYIRSLPWPDKALDILDEAGAYRSSLISRSFSDSEQSTKSADKLVDVGTSLEDSAITTDISAVTVTDVATVVASRVGMSVEDITGKESRDYGELENTITKNVIGQDKAANSVVRALRRSRAGLDDPQRPIAAFMFCGPTGVGKTQLTKILAQFYYGKKESLLRFDMSEFMEKHSAAKLIGAPPGYVGFDEGGLLTGGILERPYSLVLFDEVEKGHVSVYDLLLQVLDDGRLTDSKGQVVDFSNTLIVMTSNLGSNLNNITAETPDLIYEQLSENIHQALKEHFRPEFLNRLDEVVIFVPLGKSEIKQILELRLNEVSYRLRKSRNLKLIVGQQLKDKIMKQGYDPLYGARPLRRAIVKLLIDPLSDALLDDSLEDAKTIVVNLAKDGATLITPNAK